MNKKKKIPMLMALMWLGLTAFQVMTMMFLAYREEVVNETAKLFAVVLPVVSWALYLVVYRILKADGIVLGCMIFLCSVSLAILTRNAGGELTHHIDQAIFMAIGLVIMLAAMIVAGTLENWNDRWIWILSTAAVGALIVPRFFMPEAISVTESSPTGFPALKFISERVVPL